MRKPVGQAQTRFYSSHDHFVGCFDFMHINGYRVITKGWALSPNGSKPGDEVVIVNSRHEIVAFAQVGEPRDDVSANLDNDALRMCGWRASFELGPDQCESDKFFYAFVFVPKTQDAYALKHWFRFNQGQFEKVKRSRTGFV